MERFSSIRVSGDRGGMRSHPKGEFVTFKDHQQEVERLEREQDCFLRDADHAADRAEAAEARAEAAEKQRDDARHLAETYRQRRFPLAERLGVAEQQRDNLQRAIQEVEEELQRRADEAKRNFNDGGVPNTLARYMGEEAACEMALDLLRSRVEQTRVGQEAGYPTSEPQSRTGADSSGPVPCCTCESNLEGAWHRTGCPYAAIDRGHPTQEGEE